MAIRLCNENLDQVPQFFSVPTYNRADLKATILHIGPSGFSRSHIIPFADDLNERQHLAGERPTHGVIAVSMRHSDVHDDLVSQDYLYTLMSEGKGVTKGRVVKSLMDVMVARDNPQAVVAAAANPDIEVISATVTQAGYYFHKDQGVDFDHPDIKADLERSGEATSTIGLIYAALEQRFRDGTLPPTILSCDNLKNNGTRLRNAVLAFAQVKSPEVKDWIETNVAFPNTMVDRITPGVSKKHIAAVHNLGVIDARPVEAEPRPGLSFVIQNIVSKNPVTQEPVHFPAFDALDTIVVAEEVANYELLKLRSLNGAHMALGCVAHVLGYKYAHESMQDPMVRTFIKGFMAETGQTLPHTEGVDQHVYRTDIVGRLDNDQIQDPLTRLARNGSVDKVKERLAEPLHEALNNESFKHDYLAFAFASWIEYMKTLDSEGYLRGVRSFDAEGKPLDPDSPDHVRGTPRFDASNGKIDANDKNAGDIGLLNQVRSDMVDVAPIFSLPDLDLNGLGGHEMTQPTINAHLVAIQQKGFRQALADFLETHPSMFIEEANDNVDPALQRRTGGMDYTP